MASQPEHVSSAAQVRRWLVIRLIRWADRGWTASYSAYVRCERDGLPRRYEAFWTWCANRIDHAALRVARKLDRDNRWMGQEMANCGWWG